MKKIFVFVTLVILCLSFANATFAGWERDANGRYKYLEPASNQYVTNNWLQVGSNYYFFDNNGCAVNGWYLINGKYYLFDANCAMQVGFAD